MLSEITFTIKDFAVFILWAGLTLAAWYLVFILYRVYKTVRIVHQIVERNQEQVDATLKEVPAITRNVQEITSEVSHSAQIFRPTVDNLAETSGSVTETLKDNQNITDTLVSFFNVLNTVKKILDKLSSSIS